MNPTRLIVAAVLMAGLGGVVWWSNRQEKTKAEKPAADASPKILSLKDSDIRQIEIAKKGEPATILQKNGSGQWAITAPKPMTADQNAVSSLTSSASSLSSDRMVDEHATDLASYGLDPALISAKFTMADGKTTTLLLGETTPGGNSVYAKVDGDPRLFTTFSYSKDAFNKTYKDLRDKRLMTFDKDKVSRVELASASQAPVEFARVNPNEWQIVKPKPARADSFQVEDLLGRARESEMSTTAAEDDEKKNVAAFTSGQPVATLTVTDASGTQKLEVRKNKDDYYAKSSIMEGDHKLSQDFGKMLEKKLDDFRNKKVFDFGFNDPIRVDFKDNGMDKVVEKSGENWTSGGKTMDSVSVQAMIDKLRDLQATKFADTGFTTPQVEITVVSDNGKRTEKVQIAPAGSNFLAKREGDATLYQLDGMAVSDLRKAANDVKSK
ncbi:MAG: DUF4340 domain-containing protein [Bryobacterales bacterium]|nr:DUF4340 domain-containing protein [Bryobacterales bacterium]MBV9400340.1 DUF4340 domain-containing protein [Bryobacterales bacterium]